MKNIDHLIAFSVAFLVYTGLASSDSTTDMLDIASGTGLLIDNKYVLTASHVIDDADEILVEFSDDAPIKANVYKKNAEEDWAVLKLDTECNALPVSFAQEIQLGDKVYTLGFPTASLLGKSIKYADGSVSALTGMMNNTNTFQFSAPIQPGNSGGPIFDKDGRVVGIVLSCLDPRKFFQHTGGALPQAVNFGLKIQTVLAQATEISFTKDATRTVTQNHKATCFIRTRQKISLDKPSVYRQSGKQPNIEKGKTSNAVFDYSKVSQRYRQLAQYLENVANGIFTTLGGDAIDGSSEAGIVVLETNIENANKYLIIEGLTLVLYKATELSRSTIDSQILELYSHAKDSLWELKKKNGLANPKWNDQTFWGLKLGCKVERGYEEKKGECYGETTPGEYQLLVNGEEISDYAWKDDTWMSYSLTDNSWKDALKDAVGKEISLAGREEWPVLIVPCVRMKKFRQKDDEMLLDLITSVDGVLIGINWKGEWDSSVPTTPKPKELVDMFEAKYKIHFHRDIPTQFADGGKYAFFDKQKDGMGKDGIDRTPYAYEDEEIRIYIRANTSGPEEVWILHGRFEEIVKQGKLKAERERLDATVNISGSDSL